MDGGTAIVSGATEPPVDPQCGYYLCREHRLIRRHEESVSLNPDGTAWWELRIDFELPQPSEARFHVADEEESVFLFPLLYLRKDTARMKFSVRDESRGSVQLPTRDECDSISSMAIAQAVASLGKELPSAHLHFPEKELQEVVKEIPAGNAYLASVRLQELRKQLHILAGLAAETDQASVDLLTAMDERMSASGLDDVLDMLVEHSLVWVKLRGRSNEQRTIVLGQEITVDRRAFFRWSFGELSMPTGRILHRRRRRLMERIKGGERVDSVLMIGGRPYGRRDRRVSFSALAERVGQPLAWTPFEFELPTIYTKRCGSYHFEVRCPPGRTPRDLRVSHGPPLAEPASKEQHDPPPAVRGVRKTLTARIVRVDLPRDALGEVMRFRVTIGIGDGAFPILWFLASAITALMLWIFAADGSSLDGNETRSQTAAGILLLVPALVAGLALGSNEVPVTQLISGARILFLVTGLSAAVAAAVLTGAAPFGMDPSWTWTACAMAATAAAVPLATSCLLASPFVWRRLMKLNNYLRQKTALIVGITSAIVLTGVLMCLNEALIARGAIAAALLGLTVGMSTVANDRAAIEMGESRHYIAVSFLTVGMTCLALACIELRAVVEQEQTGLQTWAERTAIGLLLLAAVVGNVLSWITSLAEPRDDEVHVSPGEGRRLIAQESVRALPILFDRERAIGKRKSVQNFPSDQTEQLTLG